MLITFICLNQLVGKSSQYYYFCERLDRKRLLRILQFEFLLITEGGTANLSPTENTFKEIHICQGLDQASPSLSLLFCLAGVESLGGNMAKAALWVKADQSPELWGTILDLFNFSSQIPSIKRQWFAQ